MTTSPLMSRCTTCLKFQQPCLHAEPCNFWMRPTPSQSAGLCFLRPLARWPHSVAWYKNYWIRRMSMIGCPPASVQVVQLLHAEHWRLRLHQNTADLDTSSNWHSRFRGIWRTLWEHVERCAPCISISVQWHCSSSAGIGLLNTFMLKRWTGGHTFWHILQYIIVCTCVSHTQQSLQHPIAKERTCPIICFPRYMMVYKIYTSPMRLHT